VTERVAPTAFPLTWPAGWERTKFQKWSQFGRSTRGGPFTVYSEVQSVLRELERLGAQEVVISSNLRLRQDGIPMSKGNSGITDSGIAVWFDLDGEQRVLACDRWHKPEENLRAIARHINALRGQDRWGVGSLAQAFRGYQALPEHASGTPWWDALGVSRESAPNVIRKAFKAKAHECHPDKGGDRATWDALQEAYRQAQAVVAL
jgi:hypothetical protein